MLGFVKPTIIAAPKNFATIKPAPQNTLSEPSAQKTSNAEAIFVWMACAATQLAKALVSLALLRTPHEQMMESAPL